MAKAFNKRLEESDKKQGSLKRLKNIEGKSEKQWKEIKNKSDNTTALKSISFIHKLDPEVKNVFNEIEEEEKNIDYRKLVCTKTDETT